MLRRKLGEGKLFRVFSALKATVGPRIRSTPRRPFEQSVGRMMRTDTLPSGWARTTLGDLTEPSKEEVAALWVAAGGAPSVIGARAQA